MRDVQVQVAQRVFSEDGKLMGIFGEKRRIPVTVAEMPDHLKQALLEKMLVFMTIRGLTTRASPALSGRC